jgi:type III secretory pathway component EscV
MGSKAKLAQFLVPITVLAVVLMMILPLPNWILDILLCLNISFSIALLISAATISLPEKFTVLPSVLLLSTLFRLGLNVSTTRQLLGTGQAPDIVTAFGQFVVGGSLVVGLVIFLIVTLIQFIVISKGAERVAEVAARFTLDAMPGKQMSIDADLRSGSLSLPEARERRGELQRESRLYGSLDGAMKFVKGDAIAGLVITALNMLAGMLVGVWLHGMALKEAVAKYTLFTVGDGLVSQIPALLVSIAAGLVVTRVAEKSDSSIGTELFSQIARDSVTPALTAVFLATLVFLPGLPTIALVSCSLLCLMIAMLKKGHTNSPHQSSIFSPRGIPFLSIILSRDCLQSISGERFVDSVTKLRKDLFYESGLILQEPELEIVEGICKAEIQSSGVVFSSIKFNSETDLEQEIILKIQEFIKLRRFELLNDTQTRMMLDANEGRCSDLINSVIPAILSITQLTQLLKLLIQDNIPVLDCTNILQGILEAKTDGLEERFKERVYLKSIRSRLRHVIRRLTSDILQGRSALRLSGKIERDLRRLINSSLPISPELALKIKENIIAASILNSSSVIVAGEDLRDLISALLSGSKEIKFVANEHEVEVKQYIEVELEEDDIESYQEAA